MKPGTSFAHLLSTMRIFFVRHDKKELDDQKDIISLWHALNMTPPKTGFLQPKRFETKPSETKLKMFDGIILPNNEEKRKWFLSFINWYRTAYSPQLDRNDIANIIPRNDVEAKFIDFLMFSDKHLSQPSKRSTYEEFVNKELHKLAKVVDHYNAEQFVNNRKT